MSDYKDNYEEYPADAERAVAECHGCNVVESLAQHASGQAEGIEAQVAQHVAEQSGDGVVGLPQAGPDILERTAVDVIEEEYTERGYDAKPDNYPLGDGRSRSLNIARVPMTTPPTINSVHPQTPREPRKPLLRVA